MFPDYAHYSLSRKTGAVAALADDVQNILLGEIPSYERTMGNNSSDHAGKPANIRTVLSQKQHVFPGKGQAFQPCLLLYIPQTNVQVGFGKFGPQSRFQTGLKRSGFPWSMKRSRIRQSSS